MQICHRWYNYGTCHFGSGVTHYDDKLVSCCPLQQWLQYIVWDQYGRTGEENSETSLVPVESTLFAATSKQLSTIFLIFLAMLASSSRSKACRKTAFVQGVQRPQRSSSGGAFSPVATFAHLSEGFHRLRVDGYRIEIHRLYIATLGYVLMRLLQFADWRLPDHKEGYTVMH